MAGGGVRGHCGRSLLTDSSEQKRVCSVFGLRCPLTSELDHFGNQAVFFFFFVDSAPPPGGRFQNGKVGPPDGTLYHRGAILTAGLSTSAVSVMILKD